MMRLKSYNDHNGERIVERQPGQFVAMINAMEARLREVNEERTDLMSKIDKMKEALRY